MKQTAKIIPLSTSRPVIAGTHVRGLQLSLDQLVGFEGVKILARLIQEWHRTPEAKQLGKRHQLGVLARKANLCPATVSKIMNRETKSPRMLTCIMIFKALGFTAVRFD